MKINARHLVQLAAVYLMAFMSVSAYATTIFLEQTLSVLPDCVVRVRVPNGYFEKYKNGNERKTNQWAETLMDLKCQDGEFQSDNSEIIKNQNGQWEINYDYFAITQDSEKERIWLLDWLKKNYLIVQIRHADQSGYIVLDQSQTDAGTIPAEGDRISQNSGPIFLNFCLFRRAKSLCGSKKIGEKKDLLKKRKIAISLEIAKSMYFVH